MISKKNIFDFFKKVLEEKVRIIFVLITIFLLLFAIAVNAATYLEKEVVVQGSEKLENLLIIEYEAIPFSVKIQIFTDGTIPCLKIKDEIEKNLILEQKFIRARNLVVGKKDIVFNVSIKTDKDCQYCYEIVILAKNDKVDSKKCFWGEVFENKFISDANKFIKNFLQEKEKIWKTENHASMIKKVTDAVKTEFLYQNPNYLEFNKEKFIFKK